MLNVVRLVANMFAFGRLEVGRITCRLKWREGGIGSCQTCLGEAHISVHGRLEVGSWKNDVPSGRAWHTVVFVQSESCKAVV